MLNNVTIAGRLTADPELRTTTSNVSVANFTLAVDRDFKNKDGGKDTDFIPVVCWRQTAEFVSRYFAKGRMAIVNGRLQVRSYTDNSGSKRYVTEIIADNVYFGGDSKRTEEQKDPFFPVPDDEDIPF